MSLLTVFSSPSLDTLVFEGRNQAYGAYQLRQAYSSHMRRALATMLGLCTLLSLSGGAWHYLHPQKASAAETVSRMLTPIEAPVYVAEQPKPLAPPAAPSPLRMASATPPNTASFPTKITKDELVAPRPVETELVDEPSDLGVSIGSSQPATAAVGVPGGTGLAESSKGPATGTSTTTVTGPFVVVEKMPEFTGGSEALLRYLRSHLRYPGEALQAQAEGRVYVSFVVQADGTIADVSVLKGLGYGLDEEAQRVVRQMPAWAPGQQAHHAVPVRFTLPITFRIQ